MSNWLTRSMSIGQFILTVSYIQSFLYKSLFLLGILLIYREWRQGKFRLSQPEHREELTA